MESLLNFSRSASSSAHCPVSRNLDNWPVAIRLEEDIPLPKKNDVQECSNFHMITLISHASKILLKVIQKHLQNFIDSELSDVQVGFRKGKGTHDQIATFVGSWKKHASIKKMFIFVLLTIARLLTVSIMDSFEEYCRSSVFQFNLIYSEQKAV